MRRCAAKYGGLDRITFKHQGFNPTGSFKDNGMTCGAAQARRLGDETRGVRFDRQHVGIDGGVCGGRRAGSADLSAARQHFVRQAGAGAGIRREDAQVEANFDQILALVRVLAERLGIYLLNSMNPFRIEGQKSIMFEMLDQRDWQRAGLGRAAGRQSGQHVGVREGAARGAGAGA